MAKTITIELSAENEKMLEELKKFKAKEQSVDYDNPDISYDDKDIIEEAIETFHSSFFNL